ncbi:MAG: DUF1116 domain-containing protein [Candidatus Aureabacteria bacterium]|nr:DUF1116 domain-containing protein [Candidatus Auribacterota bacterium]
MITSQPVLTDIRPAREVIPGMKDNLILHAGPPIAWEKMCGPMRGAIAGALLYEGKAKSLEEAERLAGSGKIGFSPCHHHGAVGPMAGIISPSMWVFCVKNETHGNMAFATLNEGLGKVLRFGANSPDVIQRLKWMEETLAPSLAAAIRISGGINLKTLIAQALLMGDECHNRNVAATGLFLRMITPHLLATDLDKDAIKGIFQFITGNDHFFLNLSMAASKATVDPLNGLAYSTIMFAMARNGVEIGIRVAGLGDRWFTTRAGEPKGFYFPGFSAADGCLDLGDSTITETAAIGGFAMASAPAIVKFVGGVPADAIRYTKEMYEISWGIHRDFQMPALDFRGTPAGVDILKVIETGITPIINTGVAHKKPGIGQIGAGILRADMKCFRDAIEAFAKKYAA